ncbi:hypothetical protein [Microseira sp. BLCC-F43]|jgi:hypothetical protein|uniref:hypothetical protein n=1 Tax=Microseira sp. BLCC-F43 TaxID=3153602 RepID=UPI0035B82D99
MMEKQQYTLEIDSVKNCSTDGSLKTTDIKLKEGQLLIVNVDPEKTWTPRKNEPQLWVNANGISAVTNKIDRLYKEATIVSQQNEFEFALGSLIGTLDGGKTYFPVGTHLEMTILRDGDLSFFFWGGDANTNAGSLTATVEVRESSSYGITETTASYDDEEAKYFDINARVHSSNGGTPLNTGIELEPGDLLIVNVNPKDLWNPNWMDRNADINANGVNIKGKGNWPYGYNSKQNFEFRLGSLIGTLDGGKTYFAVGTHLEMTVLSKGTLSFVFWDVNWDNNRGFVRTFVKLGAPTPPLETKGQFEVPTNSDIGVEFSNTQTKEVSYTFTPSGTWKPKGDIPDCTASGLKGFPPEIQAALKESLKEFQQYLKYPNNTEFALLAVNKTTGVVTEVGTATTIVLKPGETLVFLVNDYKPNYGDNIGTLTVNWSALN